MKSYFLAIAAIISFNSYAWSAPSYTWYCWAKDQNKLKSNGIGITKDRALSEAIKECVLKSEYPYSCEVYTCWVEED